MITKETIKENLNTFLNERKDRFLNVTEEQKERWATEIFNNLNMMLEDNDIFYDNMPEEVEEND